jgi:hypothetical protein
MELPKEIEWNIVKFMRHPIAEIIDEEWNDMACTGYGNYWDEFAKQERDHYTAKQ